MVYAVCQYLDISLDTQIALFQYLDKSGKDSDRV